MRVTLALTGKRGPLAMRAARGARRAARAHRDIPCIIITVSALAGGEKEDGGGRRRRDFLSIPDWNTGWRVTSEGFLRHVPAAPVCPALARDGSALLAVERRRINSRGQPSGMIRRDETVACVWQGEGLRYFSPPLHVDRYSIFPSAPYSSCESRRAWS